MFNDNFVLLKLITQESKGKEALENPGAAQLMADWGGGKAACRFWCF